MTYCPYSDEDLEKWDGVSNPMGTACDDCENYECEHNLNPDPGEYDHHDEPYEDAITKSTTPD